MRLLAKKRLFRQKNRLKIHRHFVQKAVPINTTMLCSNGKRCERGTSDGIQSFSDDPLLEGFDPSQFNQLLPQGEF